MTTGLDWSAPAELFTSVATASTGNARYVRFPTAAEAVRFAIEDLPQAVLRGAAIEAGEARFSGHQIRQLYEAADYPLQRR